MSFCPHLCQIRVSLRLLSHLFILPYLPSHCDSEVNNDLLDFCSSAYFFAVYLGRIGWMLSGGFCGIDYMGTDFCTLVLVLVVAGKYFEMVAYISVGDLEDCSIVRCLP